MKKIELTQKEYDKMLRDLSKLQALENGGVDNWEFYDESLKQWRKENEFDEMLNDFIEDLNEILIEAKIDYPSGLGCGHSITFDEESVKERLRSRIRAYYEE